MIDRRLALATALAAGALVLAGCSSMSMPSMSQPTPTAPPEPTTPAGPTMPSPPRRPRQPRRPHPPCRPQPAAPAAAQPIIGNSMGAALNGASQVPPNSSSGTRLGGDQARRRHPELDHRLFRPDRPGHRRALPRPGAGRRQCRRHRAVRRQPGQPDHRQQAADRGADRAAEERPLVRQPAHRRQPRRRDPRPGHRGPVRRRLRSADVITLPGRFNGPPRSGNGGYVSGRLARYLRGRRASGFASRRRSIGS